ncbi:unnamed protein product [Thlaspi arvense]|uniref:non-specific serine/threonine protein kinase n=1 Tax=Thlaspi arvense TaxID=13288 RepID=A0AAU9R8J4_THLAR|nr:unnamed protein product [Thlaspi arvense]
MVFNKMLFFSSKRSSRSSDNSPSGSDKKKSKSNSEEEIRRPNQSFASSFAGVICGLKEKKHGSSKRKETSSDQAQSPIPSQSNSSASVSEAKEPNPETSASLLDLNQTKTRSESGTGQFDASTSDSRPVGISEFGIPEISFGVETPKESESPHLQALLRISSAPRKWDSRYVKSFSHELNSKGVQPFPLWKPRRSDRSEVTLRLICLFEKAKETVNSDLSLFALALVDMLKKDSGSLPEFQVAIEDMLVLIKRCVSSTPKDFCLECLEIVQELDDRRRELPPGVLKQIHTRMLYILTRCSRLLQFQKESWGHEEEASQLRQSRALAVLLSAEKLPPIGEVWDIWGSSTLRIPSTKKAYSQEQCRLNWEEDIVYRPAAPSPHPYNETSEASELSANTLPSPASKGVKEAAKVIENGDDIAAAKTPVSRPAESSHEQEKSNHRHKITWGSWGDDESCISEESLFMCRICEGEVPTTHMEYHSLICAMVEKCDQRGVSVDERLVAVSVTLGKITEILMQRATQAARESPDGMKTSNASSGESDVLSLRLSDYSKKGLEDMFSSFLESDSSAAFMDDMRYLTSVSCITRFGPKSDQGMTPISPKPNPVESLLEGKGTFKGLDVSHVCNGSTLCSYLLASLLILSMLTDEQHPEQLFMQITGLADIARSAANTIPDDDQSHQVLLSCLDNLKVVVDRRKFDGLVVETFESCIEKLIQEKYLQLCELQDGGKVNLSSTVIDEDALLEDGVVPSLRTSPVHVHPRRRISIKDFEPVKNISSGAFGRVFLARKRTTGDIFAIKVLKKADMIRKNAVERIIAERDILIKARNPFVVKFFYSFTSRENLYLVMEYLKGGDLFSMLAKLGCLDESIARGYIAEVVLALEYLHSEGVVHRDLKPDNLLIANDGHVKLADFGLSKVGLIDSTIDLSGPVISGTPLLVEEKPISPTSENQQPERQVKRSAVGTPDYLAPEILLGTEHGATSDWWSVGIILFEFIVGTPPFHGCNPENIFDNILNSNIPWPSVPEDMSHEACDLIDRLLKKDPHQRLGARGAAEVKQHIFFKDIDWDTLPEKKPAFVPDSKDAFDTSYFVGNVSNEQFSPTNENSSGCLSNDHNDGVDERGEPAEMETNASENNPFDNFSFKNLSQLAHINYALMSRGLKAGVQPCLQLKEQTN